MQIFVSTNKLPVLSWSVPADFNMVQMSTNKLDI